MFDLTDKHITRRIVPKRQIKINVSVNAKKITFTRDDYINKCYRCGRNIQVYESEYGIVPEGMPLCDKCVQEMEDERNV